MPVKPLRKPCVAPAAGATKTRWRAAGTPVGTVVTRYPSGEGAAPVRAALLLALGGAASETTEDRAWTRS